MDSTIKTIFDSSNKMRVAKGLAAFIWDDRLASSAQGHATDLANGRARPHDNLMGRIKDSGFPISDKCRISRRAMQANYSEGIVEQPDEPGEKSPEYLTSSGPGEGHYMDFYDKKITHVGIGVGLGSRMNHVVLDYGLICDGDDVPNIPDAWINGLINLTKRCFKNAKT